MSRRILPLILALQTAAFYIPLQAQIRISGPLSGVLVDTTYLVTGNISVSAGRSLTIEPGADLLFTGFYSFHIMGNLQAIGTPADSIRFTAAPGAPRWRGLDFFDSTSDSSHLEYALVTQSRDGGILCEGSSPFISHCTISENYAYVAGGLWLQWEARPIISDCVVSRNRSHFEGGGILADHGSEPWIENCIIADNQTRYFGSGIEFLDADGGNVINCLISGNIAPNASGIWIVGAGPVIRNCTIANNQNLTGTGGGISGGNSTIISNCVVWGNWPSQIIGNTQVSYCDVQNGEPGIGNIDADPLFISGPSGGYYLSQIAAGQTQQSPCVDAGDPLSAMIMGTTRTDAVQDSGIVDMGYHYPLEGSAEELAASGVSHDEAVAHNSRLEIHGNPNPFNAATILSFELRAASFVNLSVYDVSGRMVANLVNGWREAGSHAVTFDASALPSGIYIARLEAGGKIALQKLVLIK